MTVHSPADAATGAHADTDAAAPPELVVLASDDGRAIGTANKAHVHTHDTPLHFAFSAWVLHDGKVLLSRRALGKKTWPGVWTNAFCGHPGPGEAPGDAIFRRATFELGLDSAELSTPELVLPDFRYRAVDSSGVMENEICPVFVVELASGNRGARLRPNPDEVDSVAWVCPHDIFAAADATPFAFSPWMIEELASPVLRARLSAAAARA